MEFVGDEVLLRKNGIEMTDVSEEVLEKIRSVRVSENVGDGDREGGEGEGGGITSNASWLADRAGEANDGDNASSSWVTSIPISLKILLVRLIQESPRFTVGF